MGREEQRRGAGRERHGGRGVAAPRRAERGGWEANRRAAQVGGSGLLFVLVGGGALALILLAEGEVAGVEGAGAARGGVIAGGRGRARGGGATSAERERGGRRGRGKGEACCAMRAGRDIDIACILYRVYKGGRSPGILDEVSELVIGRREKGRIVRRIECMLVADAWFCE